MNRRHFLHAGASVVLAANARSYARVVGANDRVGLGVIGLGRRSLQVSNAFAQDERVDIRAICDVYDAQTAHFTGALFRGKPQPATYVRYEELLARKDIDAVYIATPDHLHVNIAKAAAETNRNIYLEKPTFHRWEERKTLIDAMEGSRIVLQCGMQQRSGAHYARAKEEIFGERKLGDVVFARAVWHNFPWQTRRIANAPKPPGLDWSLFLGPAPKVPYRTDRYSSWRYFPDYGNGLLADIMTHWVDVAQWMMNDVRPVRAASLGGIYELHDGRENPDTVSAIVQYKDWNVNFESSVLPIRNKQPSVFFEGTEGTLDLSREGYTYTPNQGEPTHVPVAQILELAHTKNFLDAITEGTRVSAPLSAGLDATLPVQMALRSYWSNKVVSASEFS